MNIKTERTPHPSKRAEIRALIAANRADYDERIAPRYYAAMERRKEQRERERE